MNKPTELQKLCLETVANAAEETMKTRKQASYINPLEQVAYRVFAVACRNELKEAKK